MIKLCCNNVDETVIGVENGLNLKQEFENYKDRIANIISDLNMRPSWTRFAVDEFGV